MTGVGHGWRHHAWKYYAAFEEGGLVSDRPFSLLLIDDEFIVDLVTSVAETAGYAVASACTPVALEVCLTQSWDIILLDLTLPELNTVTAFRLIADDLPGAVVAIFTGAEEKCWNGDDGRWILRTPGSRIGNQCRGACGAEGVFRFTVVGTVGGVVGSVLPIPLE
jgi:hypothetical protein